MRYTVIPHIVSGCNPVIGHIQVEVLLPTKVAGSYVLTGNEFSGDGCLHLEHMQQRL